MSRLTGTHGQTCIPLFSPYLVRCMRCALSTPPAGDTQPRRRAWGTPLLFATCTNGCKDSLAEPAKGCSRERPCSLGGVHYERGSTVVRAWGVQRLQLFRVSGRFGQGSRPGKLGSGKGDLESIFASSCSLSSGFYLNLRLVILEYLSLSFD